MGPGETLDLAATHTRFIMAQALIGSGSDTRAMFSLPVCGYAAPLWRAGRRCGKTWR